jgi:ABC-type amino acid transport substrate-binding protein
MRHFLFLFVLALLPVGAAADAPSDTLRVAVKDAPPFVVSHPDGSWSGLSLDLWSTIAEDLGRSYRLLPVDLQEMIDGTAAGRYDVAVAALTVTAEREERLDFSQPFHAAGLGIAVAARGDGGWRAVAERLLSRRFVEAVMALAAILLAAGIAVWLFERRANPAMFPARPRSGIGAGFWWSAVTMTTVGYGDKAPVTVGGRLVALLWMFASLIVISSFTAAIASSLTVGSLESGIDRPEDLRRVRVATLPGTASEAWLAERGIVTVDRESVEAALASLARGEVEAVVYDIPILQYRIQEGWEGTLRVLPWVLAPQLYALGLPPGSSLCEAVDRALLRATASARWRERLERYLGD